MLLLKNVSSQEIKRPKKKPKRILFERLGIFEGFYISHCVSQLRGKPIRHFQIIAPELGWQYCSCEDFRINKSVEFGGLKYCYWAWRWDATQCKHLQAIDHRWVIPAERKREREEA